MARRSSLGLLWVKIRPKLMPGDPPAGRRLDGEDPLGGNALPLSDGFADGLGGDSDQSRNNGEISEQLGGSFQGQRFDHACSNTNMVALSQQTKLQGDTANEFVDFRFMRGIGERVKARRKQLGLSTPQLAKKVGGITYQAIQALEAGGGTKHLVPIAKALGVTPEWLQDGSGPSPKSTYSVNDLLMQPVPASNNNLSASSRSDQDGKSENLLKVMGMAECGPDGWSPFNGEIVQYITRPENLRGVPGAYAVFVTGHSMEPRYIPGETAHIHPGRPTPPGSYVLVQRKPRHEDEPPLAVIKRLVKRSGSKVVLEQLNPPKQIEVPAGEIVSIHRVVGSSES